jgi:SAM-dependent methyltransferase
LATSYDTDFFEAIRRGCRASAEAAVPQFLEHYTPDTVVDVGCGEGWWGKAFADAGCKVLGIDGDYVEGHVVPFHAADLAEPLPDIGTFDLAVCLEVAEHLPPERAASFIDELCALAPVVLFSAAVPDQGGVDHLNEQWPEYWVGRFEHNGFAATGDFRWTLWGDDRIESWYRQNTLIAASQPVPGNLDLTFCFNGVLPVVHPDLFAAHHV